MAARLPRQGLPDASIYQSVKRQINRRPFVLFGLPFVGSIVGMSIVLSNFTQARYDHHEAHVHQIDEEEALQLSKDRRKVDVREEYYRLQQNLQQTREWEQKRVPRLPGQAAWGTAPPEQYADVPGSRYEVMPDQK